MAESIKAGLSVVSAHTAFTHTAEAHIGGGKMDNYIIDTAAAIPAPLGHIPDNLFVLRENIQRQRKETIESEITIIFARYAMNCSPSSGQ